MEGELDRQSEQVVRGGSSWVQLTVLLPQHTLVPREELGIEAGASLLGGEKRDRSKPGCLARTLGEGISLLLSCPSPTPAPRSMCS